ncbi:MAG: hypothetical protein M3230_06300 [Thermoproteota archaeon]|nr:hypothetical protein [Thermoproteota archaeon]
MDKKKEEEKDLELDKTIAQLGIAEYQVKKVRRILAGILDRSNPVAFSKGSSTYTFESEDRDYRVTIAVDVFDSGDNSSTTTTTIRSFRNALKSPAFVITCTLFSAVIGVLALVSLYWTSPVLGTISDRQLDTLDRQYSQILDRCAAIIHDDRLYNPRSFGAQYSICNKAIVQLQEFCKVHHISTCEDERMMDVYLGGDKART